MADNKMKNPELNRNLGGKENEGGQYGQHSPGRNPQDDQSTGQRGGNQPSKDQGGKQGGGNKGGQQGGQSGKQGASNR